MEHDGFRIRSPLDLVASATPNHKAANAVRLAAEDLPPCPCGRPWHWGPCVPPGTEVQAAPPHFSDMSAAHRQPVIDALFNRLKGKFGSVSPLDYDYFGEAAAIEAELAAGGVADPKLHRLMAEQCREIAADDGDQGWDEWAIYETALD